MKTGRVFALILSASMASRPVAAAEPPSDREIITAVAKKTGGGVAYLERHEIRVGPGGKPRSARTEYLGPDREPRAVLETDFKTGLAAADYTFLDRRDGSSHGVTVKDEGFLLWKASKDGTREEKLIGKDRFAGGALVVAGQGLFFHLRAHLKEFKKGEITPVKLLIPGRLDFFSFDLSLEDEDSRLVTFRMRAHGLLVRMFVPSLRFRFDKTSNEIVDYVGPSNLVDADGDLQSVEITYQAESRPGAAVSEKGL